MAFRDILDLPMRSEGWSQHQRNEIAVPETCFACSKTGAVIQLTISIHFNRPEKIHEIETYLALRENVRGEAHSPASSIPSAVVQLHRHPVVGCAPQFFR
ncbi:MAG: hypothetical protein AB2L11_09810 [Syntrophobacteraceae bacterium]